MIHFIKDIHPLADFKRNSRKYLSRMKESGRPVVLTLNGRAEMVIQDVESYQRLLERLERLEAVDAIRRGVCAAQDGGVTPARSALAELQTKLGFRDRKHHT